MDCDKNRKEDKCTYGRVASSMYFYERRNTESMSKRPTAHTVLYWHYHYHDLIFSHDVLIWLQIIAMRGATYLTALLVRALYATTSVRYFNYHETEKAFARVSRWIRELL